MNEKSKFKIVMGVFAAIVAIITILFVVENNRQKKVLEEFNNYFSSETEKLIYFAKDDCYYCQLLAPAKKEVLDKNNIDYFYVNTNSISTNVLDKMLEELEITKFGTPTLAVVKDNTVIKIQSGVFATETDNIKELATFINDNKIADMTEFLATLETTNEGE